MFRRIGLRQFFKSVLSALSPAEEACPLKLVLKLRFPLILICRYLSTVSYGVLEAVVSTCTAILGLRVSAGCSNLRSVF